MFFDRICEIQIKDDHHGKRKDNSVMLCKVLPGTQNEYIGKKLLIHAKSMEDFMILKSNVMPAMAMMKRNKESRPDAILSLDIERV